MISVRQVDVARRCRVSRQAVAFALSERPSLQQEVSAVTRKRIMAAARRMGYVRNHAASSLRSGVTRTVVFAMYGRLIHPFEGDRIEAIDDAFEAEGYHMTIELFRNRRDETDIYRSFLPGRYDGVVLQGLSDPKDPQMLRVLSQMRLPVVITHSPAPVKGVSTMNMNQGEATRLGVEHLLARGRRRVALLVGIQPQSRLVAGYEAALAAAGVALEQSMLFYSAVEGADTNELWARISAEKPTAIFCYNAELAVGLLSAIRASGLRVPEDVALVTHTNPQLVTQVEVPITAVDVDRREMASAVAAELLARIAKPKREPRHIVLQPVLTVRASSGGGA